MQQVEVGMEGNVAVVTLVKSVTNAIGSQLVDELQAAVERVRDDRSALAMVLTSGSDRFFSIGLDIPELITYDRDQFADFAARFDRLCMDLYSIPKPTVMAIRGHATAGGAILALCGDHRVMTSGRAVMGLNEVKLGVTVPYPTDRMLRDLVGSRTARTVMEVGDFFGPQELLDLGLVDDVVLPDQVVTTAMELAVSLSTSSPVAYAAIKGNRTGPVMAAIEAGLLEHEVEFVDLWCSEAAQAQLREAMLRF